MRRTPRLISAALLIALGSALSGCGSTSGWDPTDMLDFLDTKKPLPGERKKVFPEGVPGLEPGVPRHLYRGANAEPAPEAVAPPVEEPPPARAAKSKSRSKPAVATAPAAQPEAEAPAEEEGSTAVAPPAPKPSKSTRRRSVTAPPPDAEPQAAAPAQQSSSPFPAPLPGGSFQR
uniref:Uncharacterized protein n=1 Tax=Rhodopseudomonas palustris (strain BisA53) TaxID=316055 RepID=Q07LA6_RHOP5